MTNEVDHDRERSACWQLMKASRNHDRDRARDRGRERYASAEHEVRGEVRTLRSVAVKVPSRDRTRMVVSRYRRERVVVPASSVWGEVCGRFGVVVAYLGRAVRHHWRKS